MLETDELEGLHFVDFYFLPHLNSKYFRKMRRENIEKFGNNISRPIYALDDNCALKIVDDEIEVISEGEWFVTKK